MTEPRACDLMTRTVVTIPPDMPVTAIARILADRGISAVPVVDPAGVVLGIVTEADLIGNRFPFTEAAAEAGAATGPAATVAEVMTKSTANIPGYVWVEVY